MARLVVVSPHLDDAVLSYGARIAALAASGAEVTVFTVFAGDPAPPYSRAAEQYHALWSVSRDPVASRRDEDLLAQAEIGSRAVHGEFLDAIYRCDDDGRWVVPSGDPVDHRVEEPALVAAVTDRLVELVDRVRPDALVSCLAVGHHLDHVHARDATLAAAEQTGVPVRLWSDFPYADWAEEIPVLPEGWALSEPVVEAIDEDGWGRWVAAVRRYASQLPMLEQDGTPLPRWFQEHCAAHARSLGAEDLYVVTRSAERVLVA